MPRGLAVDREVWRPTLVPELARADAHTTNVEKIRVTDVITGNEDTPLEEMARLMIRYDVDHIPVVRDGVPIGIVA